MKLFVDHNIAPRVARALDVLFDEHEVTAKTDKFARDTPDAEWIGQLGKEGGWAVLSKDRAILRSKAERAALAERAAFRQAGLIGFFLEKAWERRSAAELTGRLLLRWDSLVTQFEQFEGSAVLFVPLKGTKIRVAPV